MSDEVDSTKGRAATGEKADKTPKTVVGVVTSDKMTKTRTVSVTRLERHTRYGKYVRRRTKYKARDEKEVSNEGDVVRIAEARPLAKTVNWRLVEVVRRARLSLSRAPASEAAGEGVSSQ